VCRLPPLALLLACASPGAAGSGAPACELRDELRAARERGDDRAADLLVERLTTTCPESTRGMLAHGGAADRAPLPGPRLARLRHHWQLRIGAQDRLVWAAAYLDGTRGTEAAPGPHQLEIEARVSSGGQSATLRRSLSLDLPAGITQLLIGVSSASPEPFRLEVIPLLPSGGSRLVSRGPGPCAAPRRVSAPPFTPPAGWLDSGAPAILVKSCARSCAEPRRTEVDSGGELPHPRLLAAAVDWLKHFQYQTPCCDFDLDRGCDHVNVRFDRPTMPAPGVATF
jgi:hypothetical protein